MVMVADFAGEFHAMFRHRVLIALAAIATVLVLVASDAQARAGGGFSGGSRGFAHFFGAASHTHGANHRGADRAHHNAAGRRCRPDGARPGLLGGGLFGGGLFGGLAAGFIGAGLFGMLFGHGIFGGIGGISSLSACCCRSC